MRYSDRIQRGEREVRITRADLEAALPDLESTIRAQGLERPVDVFRDRWGVPHVRAETDHDAFFAQGFVTAQDRLWHMDYDRHRALGRWAEFAGERGLGEDRLMRTFGVERAAREDYSVSSPAARSMLDAYAAGVNAFIETTKSLPVEYRLLDALPETWQPWHSLAVYKVRNMLMGTYEVKLWRARLAVVLGAEEAAALFRSYPDDGLVSVPPGAAFGAFDIDCLDHLAGVAEDLAWLGEAEGGSNAWVVSGERTTSGLPLLAGDSHRALDTPNVYYQTHLTCPSFRCSGYALPGVPGMPHFSHTEYVAWGMTHGVADYQDLYIERFRKRDGRLEYAFRDGWHPADVTSEHLAVRDGETRRLTVVRTRHGPVVAGDPEAGHGLAFSHPGTNSGTPWANTLCDLLAARCADEAEEALRDWTEPVNNFVYADVHGEFGYRYRGRIPIRSRANAWVPVPGWTGEHEWRGRIGFEELPNARNPAAGFVVTCNNAPTTADYPHYINTFFAPDWRARRITARLGALPAGSATIGGHGLDPRRPGIDSGEDPARTSRSAVFRRTTTCNGHARSCRCGTAGWTVTPLPRRSTAPRGRSCCATSSMPRSAGWPMRFSMLRVPIGRGAGSHLGTLYAAAVRAMAENDRSCLAPGRTWEAMLESALARAMAELRSRLGDDVDGWAWGSVHHTRPRHPLSRVFPDAAPLLDPPALATHGDGDTPLAGAYSLADRFVATVMSVNRYLHDPSDWRNSRWIVPLGASGHPGSPHYADQAGRWADVDTIPQLWDWDDIVGGAEARQTLRPASSETVEPP